MQGDFSTKGRCYHTTCFYPQKNELVVFGGECRFNDMIRIRECLQDIRIFELSIPPRPFLPLLIPTSYREVAWSTLRQFCKGAHCREKRSREYHHR